MFHSLLFGFTSPLTIGYLIFIYLWIHFYIIVIIISGHQQIVRAAGRDVGRPGRIEHAMQTCSHVGEYGEEVQRTLQQEDEGARKQQKWEWLVTNYTTIIHIYFEIKKKNWTFTMDANQDCWQKSTGRTWNDWTRKHLRGSPSDKKSLRRFTDKKWTFTGLLEASLTVSWW